MAASNPKIRLIHWPSVVLQMVFLIFLIQLLRWGGLVNPFPFIVGPLVFLVFSFGLRSYLGEHHQKGMKAIRAEQYHAALDHFTASVAYFEKKPWVDRFRAITLFSPSRMSFREMGMVNMAYCYGQMGRREEMEAMYRKAATAYPDNPIAQAAIQMLEEQERS